MENLKEDGVFVTTTQTVGNVPGDMPGFGKIPPKEKNKIERRKTLEKDMELIKDWNEWKNSYKQDSKVNIDTNLFECFNKTEPYGFGKWIFSKNESFDYETDKMNEDYFVVEHVFSIARNMASEWAKSNNITTLYVQI